ncbi:hypothetical protein LCGC14_1624630 [marine sediment metagenome]|uniref:Uncharacterized protein n=1 Tax=marine sediment metagenome TaxID=412755 RepID=A0A0F9I4H6_9ZZZZ
MLEKHEEAIRNILEKSYLAGYDKHPHFIKDYTAQIIEAVKPAIEEAGANGYTEGYSKGYTRGRSDSKPLIEEAKKEGFEAGKRYFLHTVVVDGMGTAESNNRLLNMNDIRLLPMWHDTWTHDWQVPLAAQDIIGFEAGKMLGRREAAEEIKRELEVMGEYTFIDTATIEWCDYWEKWVK